MSINSGKGGARHLSKPYVDAGLILKCLQDNSELVADMGPYEALSRNGAVDISRSGA